MNYLEIISLIEQKDRKGWENLYLIYGKKFYGFAIDNWKFNDDEAWEIVYQTLQTIILKINEYEVQSQLHFDNLVFKIFINYLRQQYRKNKVAAKDFKFISFSDIELNEDDEFDKEQVNEFYNPFTEDFFQDYLENEEPQNPKLKQLQLALSKLDPIERDLLLLKANNYTYSQIAGMLHIEDNQLKVRHHRAKGKLIKILKTILL